MIQISNNPSIILVLNTKINVIDISDMRKPIIITKYSFTKKLQDIV